MAKHKLDFCLKLYKIVLLNIHTDVVVFTEANEEKESVSASVHVNVVGMLWGPVPPSFFKA